jgi:hypothetical protein
VTDAFTGHDARTVSIDDDGARHRITWRRGSLYLLDHDLDAERTLAGLGGARPLCVEIADAWRASLTDPEILSLVCGRWNPRADLANVRSMARSSRARVPMVERWPGAGDALYRRKIVANLPAPLRIAFVVTAVDAIERSWIAGVRLEPRSFRDLLEPLVIRHLPPGARHAVRARIASPAEPAPMINHDRSGVEIVLPLRWLSDVWAHRLQKSVDGGLVLEVLARRAPGDYLVEALTFEGGRPVVAKSSAKPARAWPY